MPEKEFLQLLDAYGLNRLRYRLFADQGKLVGVVVQYETKIDDQWAAIVRYDTAHNITHRDVLHPNGKQDKHYLHFSDLNSFVQYAEQDLKDRWDWY